MYHIIRPHLPYVGTYIDIISTPNPTFKPTVLSLPSSLIRKSLRTASQQTWYVHVRRNLIDSPPLTGLLFVAKQITRLTHYAFDAVLSMFAVVVLSVESNLDC